ncbi:BcpO-related WXXGXW repeat protein [Granulicella sp. 5B5]|uniref:YXWGXW repeat-containing protein n=1 Tax=Granulicella sp. 5B5 TaxID=1617967 RepID=UPI0015F75593|nr:YXWGXW repeat-containing protein [Granulicella sp. 5B5]QMV19274.1 BcpO-related WXXGXW repeat protein [Granulicella sp. 5B5]
MKKQLLAAACGIALTFGTLAAGAQVVVRIGPPAPIVERPGPPPHRGYIWVAGHHQWNGSRYVWVPGYYMAPRPGHRWVKGYWAHRRGGYVWVDGYWR